MMIMRAFKLLGLTALLLAGVACNAGDGDRCNPLAFSSDCNNGYTCLYPTAPACGVAYCCKVDSTGKNIDPNPHCQPDPSLDSVCGLMDLSVAPVDASVSD